MIEVMQEKNEKLKGKDTYMSNLIDQLCKVKQTIQNAILEEYLRCC